MKTLADQLRHDLALIFRQQGTPASKPLVYPPELIERVLQFVRQQAKQGQSLAQCSQQLGMPRLRLHYWLYKRAKPPAPTPAPGSPLLRPVQCSPTTRVRA